MTETLILLIAPMALLLLAAALVEGWRHRHAIRRWFCGRRGHLVMLHFEDTRLSLECWSCGWRSPGWQIAPRTMHGRAL